MVLSSHDLVLDLIPELDDHAPLWVDLVALELPPQVPVVRTQLIILPAIVRLQDFLVQVAQVVLKPVGRETPDEQDVRDGYHQDRESEEFPVGVE